MKTHYKLRLSVIAASVSAALLLSACQPANDKVEAPVAEEGATVDATQADAPAMDPHAGHDMSADAMVADGTPMTPMLKEYSESMTKMHEEMMIGMDYNDPDAAFAQGMLGHHIGAVDMAEFLENPPAQAIGLAVPGMPVGSPGMEYQNKFMPYQIMQLNKDGTTQVYADIKSTTQQL